MKSYYKIKFRKMGKWFLAPADSGNWHGDATAHHFKKLFGFAKGTWIIQDLATDLQHAYFPQYYFDKLYAYIRNTNRRDYKELAKKLQTFYPLKKLYHQTVPTFNVKDFSKISTKKLISIYKKNRDWVHRIAIYDQFGWTAEDYWPPVMADILVKKYGLKKDSTEYHRALFALTKPAEISTTLEEKRDLLAEVIKIKQKKQSIDTASKKMAKRYGFMPVFTFGTPWDSKYYQEQVRDLLRKNINALKKDYQALKDYKKIRNFELKQTVKKYKIKPKDLQIFIDFGLALDVRNEAEYIVSLCGFYLLPIYYEISRRLYLSVKQVRNLYEHEIVATLEGKFDPLLALKKKKNICGWGYNRAMTKRFYFSSDEAARFFKHLEKNAKNLHGNIEGRGLCANSGKVRGKAKIILVPKDNNKVKDGDVLIAHATTVDYLPAMKRAVAFVTEVGGLTCHAAVVAREFGVPAIVSLKNATKNFKDGDRVEVDANRGIVKKVK